MKILYVEDDEVFASVVVGEFLGDHELVVVPTVEQAISHARVLAGVVGWARPNGVGYRRESFATWDRGSARTYSFGRSTRTGWHTGEVSTGPAPCPTREWPAEPVSAVRVVQGGQPRGSGREASGRSARSAGKCDSTARGPAPPHPRGQPSKRSPFRPRNPSHVSPSRIRAAISFMNSQVTWALYFSSAPNSVTSLRSPPSNRAMAPSSPLPAPTPAFRRHNHPT